jgi:pyruvate/2-oxoacid:ferredoxin oxidoreductase alpha subunit/pyruvate/2-oxoacid:ferredoxin oxidoreductase beta subunit
MSNFLSGKEAIFLLAQSINDQFYAFENSIASCSSQQLIQSNIWHRPVKIFELDSLHDPLSHVINSIANGNVTNAFMSSQSLLASIPYLHKLAADKSSVVLHVTAGLDSFADFTDVMAVRESGFALLSSSTVQEAQDLALVAQHVSLLTSTPFLHFFDSKRISDEYCSVQALNKETLMQFLPEHLIASKVKNIPALFKQSTYLRYKASQNEEQVDNNCSHLDVLATFKQAASKLSEITGRSYMPLEYVGHPEATCVIVSMGAGAMVVEQTLKALATSQPDLKVGCLKIRLYRPWSNRSLLNAIPSSVQRIAVLEPTDDYTHSWNPLFLDIAAAYQTVENDNVDLFSGQYGIQDIDFSPGMVLAIVNALQSGTLDRHFEAAELPLESDHLLQVIPDSTEQIMFVGNSSLAISFAVHQVANKKSAQAYTVDTVTHVRVAESGPLLPSLIQIADAIVLSDLLFDDQNKLASAVEAVRSLCYGGYILSDIDPDSFTDCVKKEACIKQATLVYIQNIHQVLTNSSLSGAINHPNAFVSTVPQSWINQQSADSPSSIPSLKAKKAEKSTTNIPTETPYIKMLHQAFGSRLKIANAYQASSIWSPNKSHFNAASPEFGYGRLIHYMHERSRFIDYVMDVIRNSALPTEALRVLSQWLLLLNSPTPKTTLIQESAESITHVLASMTDQSPTAQRIMDNKHLLLSMSHWLIGSDSWAYDLGQSGIHHAITSGENINILIVDTTPCHGQKQAEQRKKDIGLYAMNYGSVYVASVALYASYTGVLQALMEADAYQGPSIVLAYLPQLSTTSNPLATLKETKVSIDSGAWPLYRWNPALEHVQGQDMFRLDSQRIKKDLEAFLARENYLTQLVSSYPDVSHVLVSSLETVSPSYNIGNKAKELIKHFFYI